MAFDAADLGPAGAAVEGARVLVELGGGAGGEGFDAAIVQITNPAAETEAHRFAVREGAVADALNAPADQVAATKGHGIRLRREEPWTRGNGSGFP